MSKISYSAAVVNDVGHADEFMSNLNQRISGAEALDLEVDVQFQMTQSKIVHLGALILGRLPE